MGAIHLDEHGRAAASFNCGNPVFSLLWSGDEVIELPTLAGRGMTIEAMNDRGEIVGVVYTGGGGQVPVRGAGGDELVVVPLPSGAPGGELGDINEPGQFIGAYHVDPFDATAASSSETSTAPTSSRSTSCGAR